MKKLTPIVFILSLALSGYSQSPRKAAPRPAPKGSRQSARAVTPQAAPTPDDSAAEKALFDDALASATPAEKAEKLANFLAVYPNAAERTRALESLAVARAALGEEKLIAGDGNAAVELFRLALDEAPKPYSDRFFAEVISKIPASLFWRGRRAEAFDAAGKIEKSIGSNINQILVLANFYISVENGGEARRLAEIAVKLNEASAAAYIVLGHASRLNFALDAAAAAYAKALELEPASLVAMRSSAEMKRALGKPDEAAEIYRAIIAGNESDGQARAGLVLSLFDAGKRPDAESEMAKALAANPGNVVLLAGAAYWYAAQNDGAKAVEFGQRAVTAEPRYMWAHIALARGLMALRRPLDAEQVLTSARKYGNFPTLEYEIAAARLRAGFYGEAASEIAKSFVVAGGDVETRLGGRVARREKSLIDLIAYERRASIFEPAGAETEETANRLKSLLDLKQKLEAAPADENALLAAADEFVKGDDKMKLHRQLYVADALLRKRAALAKVLELTAAAIGNTDAALETPDAPAAVMASELSESRGLAFARGDYLLVPSVPKQTLSAILRGRIEEIAGWALYNQNNFPEAAIRLRRAVSVYPDKSAWQRSGMWRLGAVLEADGKNKEAIEFYIRSYKTGKPDIVKYVVVENLYRKLNGTLDGLEAQIGPNPLPASATRAAAETNGGGGEPANNPATRAETPITEAKIEISKQEPAAAETKAEIPKESAPTEPAATSAGEPPPAEAAPVPDTTQPAAQEGNSTQSVKEKTVDSPASAAAEDTPKDNFAAASVTVGPPVEPAAASETAETKSEAPESSQVEDKPKLEAEPAAQVSSAAPAVENATPERTSADVPAVPRAETVAAQPELKRYEVIRSEMLPALPRKIGKTAAARSPDSATGNSPFFEPVIITIPKNGDAGDKAVAGANGERLRVVAGADVRADLPPKCGLKLSDDSVSVINDGGSVGVLVETDTALENSEINAASSSPENVEVKAAPENETSSGRRFYIIKSVSTALGLYDVTFTAPCGEAAIKVRVR